jgi:hypothetical protein
VALFAVNPRQPWGHLGLTPAASTNIFSSIRLVIFRRLATFTGTFAKISRKTI